MKKIVLILVLSIFIAVSSEAIEYRIGGGDTMEISVWGNPELSTSATVRPDGMISIPALGDVKAEGMTPMELTEVIKKDLGKLVKAPIVTVMVTGMSSYRVYVIGRGTNAGTTVLNRETTLLKLLSNIGALDNADLESAYLVRDNKKIKENFEVLIYKGDYKQDIVLESGDIIFIPDNFEKRISIVGAVMRPTTMDYRDGLTLLDVILSVGGFTDFAKDKAVQIYRRNDGGTRSRMVVNAKELMRGDLEKNVAINPGDTIVVREKLF